MAESWPKKIHPELGRMATRRVYRKNPITTFPLTYRFGVCLIMDSHKIKILCYSQYKEIQDLNSSCLLRINETPKIAL
jgi:hypothetical protein